MFPSSRAPDAASLDPFPSPRSSRHALTRTLLALAVMAMGLVDLVSALVSHPPERLVALVHLVPTTVLDTSRTFTLLAGVLLLITAWGLRRGKRRAFVAALFLCAVSVPVNLLKAIDFEEATVAAGLMFALGVRGDAFQVKSRELSFPVLRSRALWAVLALLAYGLAGSWILKDFYGFDPSPARAFQDAAYQLFGIGSPVVLPADPRVMEGHRILRWYLRSLPILSLTLVVTLGIAALRPASHRRRHRSDFERAARLVAEFGGASVSAFALADDTDHFFGANGRSVIAYRFESDTLLAIGDPIGPPDEIPALLRDFERFCAERDWQFAIYQASPALVPVVRGLGWQVIHIGEDPILRPDRFTLAGAKMGDVRRAIHKAEAAGLEVHHFLPDETARARAERDAVLPALRDVSNEWLAAHPGGEKGFCMGRFEPGWVAKSWLAVARDARTGRVEGFVTWLPIPARRGWALDLMRRRTDARAGTMELLIARSVERAGERGDPVLSLSLSPLARVGPDEESGSAAAAPDSAPDRAREFLMQRLAPYYDFSGLFHWKRKFDPEFEDRYLVHPRALALPRVAWALVQAQSPGGVGRQVREWLRARAMEARRTASAASGDATPAAPPPAAPPPPHCSEAEPDSRTGSRSR